MNADAWLPAIVWLFVACSTASAQEAALQARLRADVQSWNEGRFRGAVLVARGAEVLLAEGFGLADPDAPDGARVTPKTLFDSGSVSKQFTAAAALRLHVAGVLKLDDPIAKHLPGVPADKATLTVRHLLNHSSGIARWVNFSSAAFERRDALVKDILAAPLERPIGAEFDYSNLNYFLAAALIEHASKRSFERVLEDDVFAPAGLSDTGFVEDEDLRDRPLSARIFHVEDERGGPGGDRVKTTVLDYSNSWGNKGATGVVTTVLDLHRWDRALAGDALFDETAKAELFRPGPGGYALGWQIDETLTGARRVQHSGSTRGYTSQLTRLVDDGVVIAVLSDEDGDAPALANRLEATLLAGRAGMPPETLGAFAGVWDLRTDDVVRGRFVAAVDGETLRVRARGTEAACRVLYGVSHLPDWPDLFERVGAEAEAALARLSTPDPSAVFDHPQAAAAGRRVWQTITTGSPPARVEVIGSHSGAEVVTYAEVVNAAGDVTLVRLTWAGRGRLSALETVDGPSPFEIVLIPTGPRTLGGRSLAGEKIRLELGNDGTTLSWFDATETQKDSAVELTRPR